MSCPLCDDSSAIIEADHIELRVTCEPCGPTFRIGHEVVDEWRQLATDRRAVALILAREHIRILQTYMGAPLIQVEDVRAWDRRGA